jgi:Uma2 family endonuclease
MPTQSHQNIVAFLYEAILKFVRASDLGKVLFAPLRIRLEPGKFREPDIAFMLKTHAGRRSDEFWDGADWVIEIVSDNDRRRDIETKRFEYARAGIPEYWIVDPANLIITVLFLNGDHYIEHGVFKASQRAWSATMSGFEVEVSAVFSAARQ